MKKAMKTYGIFTVALLALTLAFSTVTFANDDKGKNNNVTELKFIGNVENQPVFELNLNNKTEDEFTVTFRDEYGNVLYTDRLKGANISRKFMLKAEEFGDASLKVVVRSKNGNQTEVYSISRSHSYVEETTVNKVK
jgi:hypothetical protein